MRRLTMTCALMCAIGLGGLAATAAGHGSATKAPRAKLEVRKGKLGRFIVDAHGRTLYLFEKDKRGKSSCYGSCTKVWSPYRTTGRPTVASGVSSAKVGTTTRRDGTTQVTYGGHPLYHYDDDHKPGQTKGEGSKEFGAEWYVVAPDGKKIDQS